MQTQMRNGGDSGGPWGSRTRRAGEPESRDACGAAVWEKRRSLESRRADGTTPLTPVRLEGGHVHRSTLCRTRGAVGGPEKVDVGNPRASSKSSRQALSIPLLAVPIGCDNTPQLDSCGLAVLVCYSDLTHNGSVWKFRGAPGGGAGREAHLRDARDLDTQEPGGRPHLKPWRAVVPVALPLSDT